MAGPVAGVGHGLVGRGSALDPAAVAAAIAGLCRLHRVTAHAWPGL
jgi:hypothetical protein